jgi:hypothetical protein
LISRGLYLKEFSIPLCPEMDWHIYSFPEGSFTAEYFVLLWNCVQFIYSHTREQQEHCVSRELLKSVAGLEGCLMQCGDDEVLRTTSYTETWKVLIFSSIKSSLLQVVDFSLVHRYDPVFEYSDAD